jgi:Holliday junction resolvase
MAATPESKVKSKVTTQLRALGAYYFFPATGGFGKSGVPDIVGCLNGKFFGIECKAGKNKPTMLQQKNLAEIAQAGGIALVVNEENMNNIKELLNDPQPYTNPDSPQG